MNHMKNFVQFGRVMVLLIMGVIFFGLLPKEVRAQTTSCPDPTTHCKSECAGTETQNVSCASVCSGQGSALYYCVSSSSSTCTGGSCKASCDATTEKQGDTKCSEDCATKDSTKPLYCVSNSTTGGSGGTAGTTVNISLVNPLKYNTVQQVLMALLYALQGVIVVLSLVFIVIGAVLYITSGGNQGRVTMAKTAITAALIGLAIGILAPTFLKEIATVLGWNATAPLPSEVSSARSAADILLSVLNFLLGIVGILSIIMLVVGGVMFLTAAGSQDRITTGKKIVTYALLGVVVALASLVIVRQLAAFFAST